MLIVFGASGDLTARKLMPAIERLSRRRLLPPGFSVVGIARTEMSDDDFRKRMVEAIPDAGPGWAEMVKHFRYIAGEYAHPDTFDKLKQVLDDLDRERGTAGNRTYYLATVPSVFEDVADALGKHGMTEGPHPEATVRLVIEKPFGRDLDSARQLDAALHRNFDENQIYRIDHYLGKETVQNVLALRFANAIFEPIWNRRYVDHVQITVAEALGVEHRGSFYETAGAMRDIVQNHVLQVLSLTLMEPPATIDAQGIRDEKVKALAGRRHPDGGPGAHRRGPGPVRAGLGRRRRGRGLSRGGGGRPQQPDRDLRGHEAAGRQLALGRRPDLHPHRQAAAQAGDRGGPPVPKCPPPAVHRGRVAGDCIPTP